MKKSKIVTGLGMFLAIFLVIVLSVSSASARKGNKVKVKTNPNGGISVVGKPAPPPPPAAPVPPAPVSPAPVSPAPVPAAGATGSVAFDPPRNFSGGDGMRAVASVDLDGDGLLDLATANKSGGTVSVLLNNGDTTFSGPVNYPAGIFPFDITSGDFDQDGSPDLAVANAASNNVSVLINNGDGTFQVASNFPVGVEPQGIAAGDLNGDGKIDLAVANLGSNTVTLLFNDGKGNFSLGGNLGVGPEPVSVVTTDLDNNGSLDLAVVNNGNQFVFLSPTRVRHFGTVSVLLNNGDGTFGQETRYEVPSNPFQVIAADLDNDGDPDLATANHMTTSLAPHQWISLLRNNGDGTFAAEQKVPTQTHQGTLAAADLNGDGSLDLISANTSVFAQYEVLLNNNDGSFGPSNLFPIGAMNGVQFIDSADYDNDGDNDVLGASAFSDMFGLYLNQVVPNAAVVVGTPDLTVNITKLGAKAKNGSTQLGVEYVIQNIGDGSASSGIWGGFVYLSTDAILDAGDTRLKSFFVNKAGGLLAGQTDKQKIKITLPGDLSGQFIVIEVDTFNFITESDETNNQAVAQIN